MSDFTNWVIIILLAFIIDELRDIKKENEIELW